MKKKLIVLTVLLILGGCATTYRSVAFDEMKAPKAPDYSKSESWAAMPDQYPESLRKISSDTVKKNADVFYLYPTFLTDKKDTRWNFDIWDTSSRATIRDVAIKYQASAWAKAAHLYTPFYRQAHYRIFFEPYTSQGTKAWELAYSDIQSAFKYYLKHYNKGKPIIIAAHSQGSMHAVRLLQEFFDGTPLQAQLVAAYLPGTPIRPSEFKFLKHMTAANATGGFVTWNSFKMKKYPKNYDTYFKGSYCSNPITWDTTTSAEAEDHKGVFFLDTKLYPKSLHLEKKDGLLWVSLPKVPKRLFLIWVKDYHYADVNLFWGDIALNVQERIAAWYVKKNN